MIQVDWKNLLYGKTYCALEQVTLDKKEAFHLVLIKKGKSEISIEKEKTVPSVKELSQNIEAKQHAYLVINDKHVLSKTVTGSIDLEKAVQIAFPNIKLIEFYYEVHANDQHTFVSICRKDHVNFVLERFTKHQIQIIDFTLGNIITSQLVSHTNNSIVYTSNALVHIADQKLLNIEAVDTSIDQTQTIDGLSLLNMSINSFSGILDLISSNPSTHKNYTKEVAILKNHYHNQKIFRLGLSSSLVFLFVLLLLNFIAYSSYMGQEQELSIELQVYSQHKKALDQLKVEVGRKQKMVEEFK